MSEAEEFFHAAINLYMDELLNKNGLSAHSKQANCSSMLFNTHRARKMMLIEASLTSLAAADTLACYKPAVAFLSAWMIPSRALALSQAVLAFSGDTGSDWPGGRRRRGLVAALATALLKMS